MSEGEERSKDTGTEREQEGRETQDSGARERNAAELERKKRVEC